MAKVSLLFWAFVLLSTLVWAQPEIQPAAERIDTYLPLLKNKRVAIFANQTSVVGPNKTHLVDSLLSLGVNLVCIYAPEHGFRGQADAGETVRNQIDPGTGIRIVSLYGTQLAPPLSDKDSADVFLFDIQDVGVRFYTYISSLELFMNFCLENAKPLILLDRPNPNGFYVDGPVLEPAFRSFVGRQPIPVVYGLTLGEYANMLIGEAWLSDRANQKMQVYRQTEPTSDTPFHFLVVKCKGYTHKSHYQLPVRPSPNLPDMRSVYLYPSVCFFEGTEFSLGRGTAKPFQQIGHPRMPKNLFSFTPQSMPGAKSPPQQNKQCFGYDLSSLFINPDNPQWQQIQLQYLLTAYKTFLPKDFFFLRPKTNNPLPTDYFFNKLAGNANLMWQIMNNWSETEIRKSWKKDLDRFKKLRTQYLLYPDFE